jgi:tripartite-type tricarboxylate transporter receptor subunit TctC
MTRRLFIIVASLIAAAAAAPSEAQEFPTRPIRIVVPFTPAGAVDVLGRLIAERVGARWKTGAIVENRPGAGTVIGTDTVAKAAPDGYTILLAVTSHAVNATLVEKLPFDPIGDFAPIVLAATAQNILAVNPSVAARTPAELIALAKANPGKLNAASPGKGTTLHLAAEMLKTAAGIDFTIVHYKGSQPALTALLSGEVAFMFDPGTVVPQAQAGKVRILAVTGAKRSPVLPDVPTMIESGLPGFEVVSWYGFFVPAGTPRRVIDELNRAINDAVREKAVQERMARINMEPAGSTPEEFDRFVREQIKRWGAVIRAANVKQD